MTINAVDKTMRVGSGGVLEHIPSSDWQLDPGHYESAQIPMEIINPQEGLTTGTSARSYYYRTYPGLEWRVPISVLGGAWPFKYELVTGPTGMAIGETYGDTDYGILNWANPTAGSHSVSVTVTDQEGTTDTHTWTLTVTTDNTLFVDAVSGNDSSGDGSFGNPFQTFEGWYLSDWTDGTYNDHHVYYMTGTYYSGRYNGPLAGKMYMQNKPGVHIAYPGESPEWDFRGDGGAETDGGRMWIVDSGTRTDWFVRGIKLFNTCKQSDADWNQCFSINNGADRFVVSECQLGPQYDAGKTGSNPAYLMTRNSAQVVNNISFHNNTVVGLETHQVIETYQARKLVFEGNIFLDGIGVTQRGVYAKVSTAEVTVRNNVALDDSNVSALYIDSSSASGGIYDEMEACWNNVKHSGTSAYQTRIGISGTSSVQNIYIYRNTFTGGYIRHGDATGGGPVWYQNNVRQYDSYGPTGIRTDSGALYTVQGTETDLVANSGLVDGTTNLLTGANRTAYLGLKGHEVN